MHNRNIIQQLYREILSVADENGGKLKNRCIFFCDEWGTLPKIESAEMMFSASRSRRLQIVPIIQSFAQLEKNYTKEGADVIIDNTQLTIFGGFAPNSTSAETISKALGSRTVMSGSVSRGKDNSSQSIQMIERALLTADELKNLPKGTFVVMKTGYHPMRVKLKLFFKWGIDFEEPYVVSENGNRRVMYANRISLTDSVIEKYRPEMLSVPDDIPYPQEHNTTEAEDTPSKLSADKKKHSSSGKATIKPAPEEDFSKYEQSHEKPVKFEHKPDVAKRKEAEAQ